MISTKKEFKILFIGVSGSGKSTLINFLANVIAGRSYEDERIFAIPCKLKYDIEVDRKIQEHCEYVKCNIPEFKEFNSELNGDDADSKTRFPCFYQFEVLQKNTIYTLIDTPGLNDTKGSTFDFQHMQTITHSIYFAHKINLICIVGKASDSRLGEKMKSAIESLKKLFTTDSMKSFAVCLTNSPKEIPPNCMDMLKMLEIPTENTFRFENSCLTPPELYRELSKKLFGKIEEEIQDSLEVIEKYWKKSKKSATWLLEHIEKVPARETRELLNEYIEHQAIEKIIYVLSDDIFLRQGNLQLEKAELANLKQTLSKLSNNGQPQQTNGKIKVIVSEPKVVQYIAKEKKPKNLIKFLFDYSGDALNSSSILDKSSSVLAKTGVVVTSPLLYLFDKVFCDGKTAEKNGYFVWVDVRYYKKVKSWRLEEQACSEEAAAEHRTEAEIREDELQLSIEAENARILSMLQIIRTLVERLDSSRPDRAESFSPSALKKKVDEQIKQLNDSDSSNILNTRFSLLKEEFSGSLKMEQNQEMVDQEAIAFIDQVDGNSTKTIDDLKKDPKFMERLCREYGKFKEKKLIQLVSAKSRLDIISETIEAAMRMELPELSQEQLKELNDRLVEQKEKEQQIFAEMTAKYRTSKPYVVPCNP